MKHLIEALILVIPPVIYKLYRDRNGNSHPDPQGVLSVAVVMFICVTLARLHYIWYEGAPFVIVTTSGILWWYLKAFMVAVTGYGLMFQPLMNRVLNRKNVVFKKLILKDKLEYCFDHLSPTAIPDKWFLKYRIGWKLRLSIYLTLFIGSIVWFVYG